MEKDQDQILNNIMIERKKDHFYNLYLVRTKGLKSIIYRVIHNSYWDSIVFISEFGSVMGIDEKGIFLESLPEYKKQYQVIAVKKAETFFIEEGVAFERFLKLKHFRKPKMIDYRNLIQNIVEKIGKFLGLKFIQNIKIKSKSFMCSSEFIINMFDVSKDISYNDKSISWFEDNDIYDFLNLPKN